MTMPIDNLTLDEKIGQMLCFGWSSDAQADACVREMKAGGMIVMGRNVGPEIERLRTELDALQAKAALPLLLPTDQEGGRVARLRAPLTPFPSAKTIGDTGDPRLARDAARVIGTELRIAGINANFAPVADVNSNPANPVIGDRAFGDRPDAVAAMVAAQVAGYADAGILACAKHFPGHGDTALDSHFALPTLPFDRDAMDRRELVPFRAAIAAGVPAIMTAHILFPAVDDSGLPATMSPAILTGLLRETLGFGGLIVTDCLEMKAVADGWGTARSAMLAAKAGADVLLVCHTLERQRETFDALRAAVRSGELPEARVHESAARVLAAKSRLAPPPFDATRIGSPEHRAVAESIAPLPTVTLRTTLGAEAPG